MPVNSACQVLHSAGRRFSLSCIVFEETAAASPGTIQAAHHQSVE